MNGLFPVWTDFCFYWWPDATCCFIFCFWEQLYSHIPHFNGLFPSWSRGLTPSGRFLQIFSCLNLLLPKLNVWLQYLHEGFTTSWSHPVQLLRACYIHFIIILVQFMLWRLFNIMIHIFFGRRPTPVSNSCDCVKQTNLVAISTSPYILW